MAKLDSNFNAPFHVITDDGTQVGVVNSYDNRGDADTNAASVNAQLEATGNTNTEAKVIEGQEALAQYMEDEHGVARGVQTDNSGRREAEQVAELTGEDPTKTKSSSTKSTSKS